MLSTWLFIIIIGNDAQAIEVRNLTECMQLRQYADVQIEKNKALKGKAATGCFKNLGMMAKET